MSSFAEGKNVSWICNGMLSALNATAYHTFSLEWGLLLKRCAGMWDIFYQVKKKEKRNKIQKLRDRSLLFY
jgi:hypothetical protein